MASLLSDERLCRHAVDGAASLLDTGAEGQHVPRVIEIRLGESVELGTNRSVQIHIDRCKVRFKLIYRARPDQSGGHPRLLAQCAFSDRVAVGVYVPNTESSPVMQPSCSPGWLLISNEQIMWSMMFLKSFCVKKSWFLNCRMDLCDNRPYQKKESRVGQEEKMVLRRWTKDDVRLLKSMAKDKKSANKIAKALKRTVFATRAMAVKRGLSLSTRG